MAVKDLELALKRAGRVKKLLESRPEMTQKELGEKIHIGESQMSGKMTGTRNFTENDVKLIAELFPPVRWQWIYCSDDYMTDSEQFEAQFESWYNREKNLIERKQEAVSTIAALGGFDVVLYSSGFLNGAGKAEDVFIVRRKGDYENQIYVGFSELEHWCKELSYYMGGRLSSLIDERGSE